jgi:hypothetical protein
MQPSMWRHIRSEELNYSNDASMFEKNLLALQNFSAYQLQQLQMRLGQLCCDEVK